MKSKFNIFIDERLKKSIKQQAIEEGRTASNVIEELIYDYLTNEGYLFGEGERESE